MARSLLKIAEDSAKKAKSVALTTRIAARGKEIAELRKEFDKTGEAFATLEKKPDDADANLTIGKYLCFQKGQWDKGLPHLVKGGQKAGSEAKLKELAQSDLDTPTEAAKQVQVGEGWWALSQTETGIAKKQLQWRAKHWYEAALPNLTGLTKTRVEKNLKSMPDASGATDLGGGWHDDRSDSPHRHEAGRRRRTAVGGG